MFLLLISTLDVHGRWGWHTSLEEDLSLKIEVHDQNIWKSTPELYLVYSIQMKSKSIENFSQKSTRWHWP